MSIGTEDADALAYRAETVRYDRAGLTLELPPLPGGAWFEVHFAVATAAPDRDDDVSTWYAVDADPRKLSLPWLAPPASP